MFWRIFNQNSSENLATQRCSQCKTSIRKKQEGFFCCRRKKIVCQKCSKNVCKQCGKKRENKVKFVSCCSSKCQKVYGRDDMFYDFKGNYQICPKCLRKEYQFYYQKTLKENKEPEEVKLHTKSLYPYKDLVNYFKHWCFSCANKIEEHDAYQMIRGPRICVRCIELNTQKISHMIRCISCQGYIHTLKEISQTFGSESEVICVYCAEKHKSQLQRASTNLVDKIKQVKILNKESVKSSVIKSALKIFQGHSQGGKHPESDKRNFVSESRFSSANSVQCQLQDLHLAIFHQKTKQQCDVCQSFFPEWNLFSINKTDHNLTSSILKLLQQHKREMKMCALCFGENVEDHGQTIQFDTPPTRTLKIQEENMKQPEITLPKKSIAKEGASQNVFKNST